MQTNPTTEYPGVTAAAIVILGALSLAVVSQITR